MAQTHIYIYSINDIFQQYLSDTDKNVCSYILREPYTGLNDAESVKKNWYFLSQYTWNIAENDFKFHSLIKKITASMQKE